MRPLIATILSAAILAAAPAAAKDKPTGEEKLAKILEGRVAGEPQDCITLSSATSSQVVDDTAIVYRIGSTLWVNRPRGGAESLDGDDNILVTKLTGTRLCSIDTIELHDRNSHMYAGFVSLGEFVPYRKIDTAAK
ncbi:hypothetical protein [Sphingopyxis sp. GW247-27LB]|jgi:hypothetical protein|uniref:hypothetical protein n=1 Tax=Sphingopyxis sp. GW247-27LB TaxID=2012632 RepID=UPI000BA68574|nr:hypothetical protein [Sphingopyxis sp. GW247-27LB]PAL22256.1 hypothetical protein CD928_09020 [Sphingopyxis sp. GW247-27LB]